MTNTSHIWDTLPRPALILAPMEGVTDAIFRQVVARAGRPDLFFTEFTNVSSYASAEGRHDALARLAITPSDPPIIAQVWGKNPAHFALTVAALANLGFAGVDLNFGCPDRHVIKAGGGSNMIREPQLALECLHQAQAATNLPVSVKTRLGYSAVEEFRTWLPTLFKAHPAALTVHLRTKKEMSKVPAHYELIPEILALRDEFSPETKLILNGDIKDRTAAFALAEQFPTADGFMIGRGVFQNPCCFRAEDGRLNSTEISTTTSSSNFSKLPATHQPSRTELLDLLNYHLDLFEAANESIIQSLADANAKSNSQTTPEHRLSFEPLKHFFKIYINNFPGAAEIRAELMQTHSVAEARAILNPIKRNK